MWVNGREILLPEWAELLLYTTACHTHADLIAWFKQACIPFLWAPLQRPKLVSQWGKEGHTAIRTSSIN